MRQGQQHKRMRGRNRKGPNPMSRSFESNGPDVKIRGTALHIAEKYVTLARDAASSGDRVGEQRYLQHAEHYFRIVSAAQAQMPAPPPVQRGDDEDGEERDEESPPNSDRLRENTQQREPQFARAEPPPHTNGAVDNGRDREAAAEEDQPTPVAESRPDSDAPSRSRSRRSNRPRQARPETAPAEEVVAAVDE